MFLLIILIAMSNVAGCRSAQSPAGNSENSKVDNMDKIAESYVKLVLAVGQHDDGYVDAYYGPAEWQQQAKAQKKPLDTVKQEAQALLSELEKIDTAGKEEIVQLRRQYLIKQLQAVTARIDMLKGAKLSFDEESKALYDAVAPTLPESHFQEVLAKLDKMLPGQGALTERYAAFRKDFIIPKEKVDTVFKAAIEKARTLTRERLVLPVHENFKLEYVTNKSWSGYNYYQGNSQSLIQINTDLPIYIDRAIDLAAHEGYPGHHVYNLLLEKSLVKERGWVEYSVYPLYSPQSLIAEGSANYGIEVVFPKAERLKFEREVLFPLAGIDAGKVETYYAVLDLAGQLDYAGNEAARRYLNGEINGDKAAELLSIYALMTPERARQRVKFFDQYRSYVINYNLGKDLVKDYLVKRVGAADNPAKRWEEFGKLLSSPRLPSGLKN